MSNFEKSISLLVRMKPSEKAMLELVAEMDGLCKSAELMHLLRLRYRQLASDNVIMPTWFLDKADFTATDKLVMSRYYYFLASSEFITKKQLIDFCGNDGAVDSYKQLLSDKHIVPFILDL